VHPLVRRHLPTGLPILYLPTRRDSIVVGWSDSDSSRLLADLWGFVERSQHRTSVALVKNDLLFWDNAATVHSREGWPADQGRAVWHVAAEGEIPTPLYGKRAANIYGSKASTSRS
jgi:taurine dioxygenase